MGTERSRWTFLLFLFCFVWTESPLRLRELFWVRLFYPVGLKPFRVSDGAYSSCHDVVDVEAPVEYFDNIVEACDWTKALPLAPVSA